MTGKYIDFKGKLKVGDRVRVNSEEACTITSVDDRGFGYRCGDTDFYKVWGTLELLSPSPRVVTLETLEPGDEVEKDVGGVMVRRRILDATKANGWLISSRPYNEKDGLRDSDRGAEVVTPYYLLNTDYKPVQPASPPAPAEKEEEWWESHFNRHFPNPEDSWIKTWAHFLVDEAMRRGEEKAWVDASVTLGCIEAGRDERWPENVPWNEEGSGWDALFVDMNKAIASKISSLNKPAGAGK